MTGNSGKSSQVTEVLARLGSVGASVGQEFIASSTFQGAKPGYYFGTSNKGTGYYIDDYQKSTDKKRKRTVRIAEEANETKFVPSLLEQAEKDASGSTVLELTQKGIQSAANALIKIFNQNALQRARFPDEPRQYMNSELSLYEQLTALQAVAANAHLYQHLLDNEALMTTLSALLGHENSDICAVTVALFLEWIDPSLLLEEGNSDLTPVIGALAAQVLSEAFETVVSNLARFQSAQSSQDDTQDQALKGIENSLSLMENLLELDLLLPDGLLGAESDLSAAAYMVKSTNIVSWFFQQIHQEQTTNDLKGRSMELLSVLAQKEDVFSILPDWSRIPPVSASQLVADDLTQPKKKGKVNPIQGIEVLLQVIGAYRKKQPGSDQMIEYLENTCVLLSCCISFSTSNLSAFLEGQGIELILRCLKESVHAGACGLKLLDFFGSDPLHKRACEHLVKAGGLKYLFPVFVGTRIPRPSQVQSITPKAKREWLHSVQTQVIRILYALSRYLDDQSPEDAKARFLSKFLEDDRKCDRLVELMLMYDQKMQTAEYNFYRRSELEDDVDDEEVIQLAAMDAKLKGGGELFHRLGAIAALICVRSKRCHERILSQLQLQQSGIGLIKTALAEFSAVLGSGTQKDLVDFYLKSI